MLPRRRRRQWLLTWSSSKIIYMAKLWTHVLGVFLPDSPNKVQRDPHSNWIDPSKCDNNHLETRSYDLHFSHRWFGLHLQIWSLVSTSVCVRQIPSCRHPFPSQTELTIEIVVVFVYSQESFFVPCSDFPLFVVFFWSTSWVSTEFKLRWHANRNRECNTVRFKCFAFTWLARGCRDGNFCDTK